MIYVASPYTSGQASAELMQKRFEFVEKWCAEKMKQTGYCYLSPVVYGHQMAINNNLPKDWAWWEKIDTDILYSCDSMVVLKMPMWRDSEGIYAEIAFAEKHGIPVEYVEVDYEE